MFGSVTLSYPLSFDSHSRCLSSVHKIWQWYGIWYPFSTPGMDWIQFTAIFGKGKSALHFILQSLLSKIFQKVPFSWVLVLIYLGSILVWNQNRVVNIFQNMQLRNETQHTVPGQPFYVFALYFFIHFYVKSSNFAMDMDNVPQPPQPVPGSDERSSARLRCISPTDSKLRFDTWSKPVQRLAPLNRLRIILWVYG